MDRISEIPRGAQCLRVGSCFTMKNMKIHELSKMPKGLARDLKLPSECACPSHTDPLGSGAVLSDLACAGWLRVNP